MEVMDPRRPGDTESAAEDAWSYLAFCPNCGARLQPIKCKACCRSCGFFQDCGDTIV